MMLAIAWIWVSEQQSCICQCHTTNILLLNSRTRLIWNLKYTETKQEYNDLPLYSWLIIIIIAYLSEIQKVALSPQSSICPILTIRYRPTTLLIFHTQYQATGYRLNLIAGQFGDWWIMVRVTKINNPQCFKLDTQSQVYRMRSIVLCSMIVKLKTANNSKFKLYAVP